MPVVFGMETRRGRLSDVWGAGELVFSETWAHLSLRQRLLSARRGRTPSVLDHFPRPCRWTCPRDVWGHEGPPAIREGTIQGAWRLRGVLDAVSLAFALPRAATRGFATRDPNPQEGCRN